jgi:putative transferase (TIGR04331 family)
LHQVLAMNIPTVAYWNDDHWSLASQSLPFFGELERVGILHRSGSQAGQFVSDRFDQIELWWAAEATQAARTQWCQLYARTSENWVREWFLAIWGANDGR